MVACRVINDGDEKFSKTENDLKEFKLNYSGLCSPYSYYIVTLSHWNTNKNVMFLI